MNGLKKLLGADDSLDVFGVHGVCGIMGALLTGVFNSPNPVSYTHLDVYKRQGYDYARYVARLG